jgi:2-keto-3-deoxy-L-fuconate dehydrogenase
MNGFNGRVIVITGGAAGIGRACVDYFIEQGAIVGAVDIEHTEDLPNTAHALRADVTDQAGLDAAMREIGEQHGRIDVLVNNAGVSYVGDIETGELSEWNRLWDVNLLGYVRATRAALPYLRKSDTPAIVNMSSCTAESGLRQRALYSATKGAIEAMTRAMAADLISERITVNAVSPGTVDTPFMADLARRAEDPEQRRRDFESRQPTNRMVAPEEVALAVAYLGHPSNRSSVGTVVTVDGGMAALHLTRA